MVKFLKSRWQFIITVIVIIFYYSKQGILLCWDGCYCYYYDYIVIIITITILTQK